MVYINNNNIHFNIVVLGFILKYSNAVQYEGRFAAIGELPYVVHLSIENKDKGKAVCTGALIDESWVITAAHCLHIDGEKVDPEDVSVSAGINDFSHLSVPTKQQSNGYELIIHPEYQPKRLSKFDLGLIQLRNPFKLNVNVSTIELEGTAWPLKDGTKYRECVAGGFGRISMTGTGNNTKLKYLNVKGLHGEKSCPCTKRWQWKSLVCLKPELGCGLCPGDSGSVLACDNKTVGIAHVIMDKRECSFIHMPDPKIECLKDTTVTYFMFTCPANNWIKQHVPNVPSTPVSCKSYTNEVCLLTILTAAFILTKLY